MTIDDLLIMLDREVQIIVNFLPQKDLPFPVDFDLYEYKQNSVNFNLDKESSNKGKS